MKPRGGVDVLDVPFHLVQGTELRDLPQGAFEVLRQQPGNRRQLQVDIGQPANVLPLCLSRCRYPALRQERCGDQGTPSELQ